MPTLLSLVKKGSDLKRPRRTLIYGPEGCGKSTWAAQWPGHLFLQTEDGLGDIECTKLPGLVRDLDQVFRVITELYEAKHTYKCLVIDTLDWLERLVFKRVCADHRKTSIEDIGYAKGYIFALKYWNELLEGFNGLLLERDMDICLIAHSSIDKFRDPTSEAYDRYAPKLDKRAQPLLIEWCDEVLFCRHRVLVQTDDEGFGRTRARATGAGSRLMYTEARPAWVAKHRMRNLPPEIPLDFSEYSKIRWGK